MNIVRLEKNNRQGMDDVMQMLVESFPHSWPNKHSALEVIDYCLEDGNIALVAVEAGQVLGFIGGQPQYGQTGWELHPLVVRSDRQGRGIGAKLVRALEGEILRRGGVMIYLGTDDEEGKTTLSNCDLYPNLLKQIGAVRNLDNHPFEFYKKVGFEIVGVLPDANGLGKPDILMAKRLGRSANEDA